MIEKALPELNQVKTLSGNPKRFLFPGVATSLLWLAISPSLLPTLLLPYHPFYFHPFFFFSQIFFLSNPYLSPFSCPLTQPLTFIPYPYQFGSPQPITCSLPPYQPLLFFVFITNLSALVTLVGLLLSMATTTKLVVPSPRCGAPLLLKRRVPNCGVVGCLQ